MQELESILSNVGIGGGLIAIIWLLLQQLFAKKSGTSERVEELADQVFRLENNHIDHLRQDISELKGDIKNLMEKTQKVENRLYVVETELKICKNK